MSKIYLKSNNSGSKVLDLNPPASWLCVCFCVEFYTLPMFAWVSPRYLCFLPQSKLSKPIRRTGDSKLVIDVNVGVNGYRSTFAVDWQHVQNLPHFFCPTAAGLQTPRDPESDKRKKIDGWNLHLKCQRRHKYFSVNVNRINSTQG